MGLEKVRSGLEGPPSESSPAEPPAQATAKRNILRKKRVWLSVLVAVILVIIAIIIGAVYGVKKSQSE